MSVKVAKEVDLGKGSVGKLLFRLAMPAIAAQIINVLYNMVDRMYIGHIEGVGHIALTGVGVTMPVIMAVSAFAMLVAMGGAPRASIMLGKGDKPQAEKILGNSVTLLVGISVILTVVILVFGKDMLLLFGASENTLGYGWDYLQIYAIGTIFVEISLGLNAFINAEGYAKTGFMTVAIGAVLNIALDPLFIYGFQMGVKGAAIATVVSQAVSAIWVTVFLSGKRSFLRIKLKNLIPDWKIILPCVTLGLSPFIMQFTESVISVCFNSSLLKYGGDLAVGAMTILTSVMQFSLLPLQGLTQGAQPITGFNFGQGKIERVEKCFKILLVSCLAYSTVIWTISVFLPKAFILVFASDATLVEYSVRALRVYMAGSLLFGAQIACQQTFIALGNAKISIFLAVLRKIILLIPLIFALPLLIPENPAFAVYLAEPIADVTAVIVTVSTFLYAFSKLKKKMKSKDADLSARNSLENFDTLVCCGTANTEEKELIPYSSEAENAEGKELFLCASEARNTDEKELLPFAYKVENTEAKAAEGLSDAEERDVCSDTAKPESSDGKVVPSD